MGDKPKDVTDEELENLVQRGDRVVVDFWAPWCQPCKVISPIVEDLAQRDDGGIRFVKLNIDENPESPVKYGIMGVPTLLFFKDGDLASRIVGVVPRSKVEATLKESF